jgi:hypothetical protein
MQPSGAASDLRADLARLAAEAAAARAGLEEIIAALAACRERLLRAAAAARPAVPGPTTEHAAPQPEERTP